MLTYFLIALISHNNTIMSISILTVYRMDQLPRDWNFLLSMTPAELDNLIYSEYNKIDLVHLCHNNNYPLVTIQ